MKWDLLTSNEIEALDRNIPVVLPISATEQHGPHLPLATDRMIGEHFCEKLNEELNEKILILPSISFGYSQHHMDFGGTLTFQHQSFQNAVEDIVTSVQQHGFSNILIFNSHGGNSAVGQVLIEKLGNKFRKCKIVMITWWKIASEELITLNDSGPGGIGHAGEFETSLMLAIAPELVKMNLAQSIHNNSTFPWAEGDMLRGAKVSMYRTMKEMTTNGVYGDPTYASKEKGYQISSIVVSVLINIVEDLYKT